MSNIAVRVDNVSKKFRKGEYHDSLRDLLPSLVTKALHLKPSEPAANRDFWALKDLSFEVQRGEAFGILGGNGAGKSTLLKLISRIMKPTSGSISVAGRLSAVIEVNAGFHPDLTGRENIFLNGAILGMRRREVEKKFDEIVAFSDLAEFIDTPVKRYSSGMYARLGFSVAAHVNPDVLIIDEVLSVGDLVFQRKCVERMREIIEGGATVLFVSHNLKNVVEFCNRCVLIERGREMMIGSPNDVIQTYMKRSNNTRNLDTSKSVFISQLRVRNRTGESIHFESGETAWIDVEITARAYCAKISAFISFFDESYNEVFHTSTERLGHGNFNLQPGEKFTCTFEIQLNMAIGAFQPRALVYRYDTQVQYDSWDQAGRIYVSSPIDARGIVNCFPKVIRQQIITADATEAAPIPRL